MSLSTTGKPAAAIVWAICPPMVPAPTTAALNTNMLVSSSCSDYFSDRAACSAVPTAHAPSVGPCMHGPREGRMRPSRPCRMRHGPSSISGGNRRGLLGTPRKQRFACDHKTLNLRGALVQLHDLGVAEELLDGVLLDEAIATVDLNRVGRDLHRGVGGEALGVRGDERVA